MDRMQNWKAIHERALIAVRAYKRCESVLLEILAEVDAKKIFHHFGMTSTFSYCVKVLGLSEDQAYAFIRVSRKAEQIPELKRAVDEGMLTVSKAKKIASVITPLNQQSWIEKAVSLPTQELERQVAISSPRTAEAERIKPVAADVFELVVRWMTKAGVCCPERWIS